MGNKYSMMKVFHFKDKVDSLPRTTDAIQPPLHIRIKPINACNHACSYCAYRDDSMQLGKDMRLSDSIPEAKMMEIIDDAIDMGVKAITFSGGGEPLFYPHMEKVLHRLADSPIKFATLTNGALLTGELGRLFAMHSSWVRISMDGWDNASYSKFRKIGDGEYDKILNNISEFKRHDGPSFLGVNYVIGADNAAHIYEAVKRIRDAGVDSVKISPCIVENEGSKNNEYHQPFYEVAREQIQRVLEDFTAPGFEIFDSYHLLSTCFEKEYDWCPFLQVLPVIGADQNVYACHDKAYNLDDGVLGSIKDVSFKDFWMNDKSKFFKINPAKHCNHHCVVNSRNKMLLEYYNTDQDHLGFI